MFCGLWYDDLDKEKSPLPGENTKQWATYN
jgi:hypothetical protein